MALWRVEEAAEYLGIRPKTLYEWVRTGRVPHRKIGFNVRFDPAELESWAAAQAEGPRSGSGSRGARSSESAAAVGREELAEVRDAALEAAETLRDLQREVGTQLSFPRRQRLEKLARRLEKAATGVEPD